MVNIVALTPTAPKPTPTPTPTPKPYVQSQVPTYTAPTPTPAPTLAPAPMPTAAYNAPKYANEQAARNAGYTGDFGAGGAAAWAQDPANAARQLAEFNKLTGQNFTSMPGADQNPLLTQLQAPGVQTVGSVEPLNDMQKQILSLYGSNAPTAADMQKIKDIFSGALTTAQKEADPNENPFLKTVIDQAREQSLETRRRLDPTLNQGATAAGAFGSTRDGVQRALADEMIGKNFDAQASGLLNDSYYKSLQGNLQKAALEAQLGGQSLALFNNLAQNALMAGDRVQGQNQALVDASNLERLKEAGYDKDMLTWLAGILSGTGQSQTQQTPSALQGALGGGLAGWALTNSSSSGSGSGSGFNLASLFGGV